MSLFSDKVDQTKRTRLRDVASPHGRKRQRLGVITPVGYAHLQYERNRWDDLDKAELFERVKLIRNPVKLRAFICIAKERNSEDLLLAGCRCARNLGLGYLIPRESITQLGTKDVDIGRKKLTTRKIRI
jgi:hypothetical protein